MGRNAILAPISLILLAGAIVLLFLLMLPGVTHSVPLKDTYFLQAETGGITGARPYTQWTYFYVCARDNLDCSGAKPAPALGWAWDSHARNVPAALMGSYGGNTTSKYFYYDWKFGWVFFLLSLIFTVVTFLAGFLACCGRLGAAIAGLTSVLALVCQTIAASLMTDCFVKMARAFQAEGRSIVIGKYAFGFAWGAWAAIFIATVLLCMGTRKGKDAPSSGRSWGRRRKSVRSRRSYDMGGRRVKEDYA